MKITTPMQSRVPAHDERRRAPRATELGSAVVRLGPWTCAEYRLGNVSAGGALLTGGPPIEPERRIDVLLKLRGDRPMAVSGRVLRSGQSRDDGGVAVQFEELEPSTEDRIQDAVVTALSGKRLRRLPTDVGTSWRS
jgi:hypothetical protein